MKVYFPNLNGLRFIAALMVIVHHVEQFRNIYGLDNHWDNPSIRLMGELGVTLFFVLSGFLITFLLLKEKELCNDISVRNFYFRRLLRIWPLYYLLVFLGFILLPEIKGLYTYYDLPSNSNNYYKNLISYLFYFPHWSIILFGSVPYIGQLWSIGVEEQFYLFWPIIAKYSNDIIRSIVIVGAVYLTIKVSISIVHFLVQIDLLSADLNIINRYRMIVVLSRFDCMAFGGVLAYSHFKGHSFVRFFKRPVLVYGILGVVIALVYKGFHVPYFNDEFYACLFGFIILGLSTGKRIFILENKISFYLGQISYGIYMYHVIAIGISLQIVTQFDLQNSFYLYVISIALTLSLSAISYHLFERHFLNLKNRFSKIVSGIK